MGVGVFSAFNRNPCFSVPPEFAETLPSGQDCVPLLCPNQNEPTEHAVLRERRDASAAP